jgi:hypothetical protein
VVDAMAEKFADESPYNYAGNNPISNIDIAGLQKYATNELFINSMFGSGLTTRGSGGITRNIGPTNKDHSDYENLSEETKNNMTFEEWFNEKSKHQYDCYSTYGTNINNTGGHWERVSNGYTTRPAKPIDGMKDGETLLPEIQPLWKCIWVEGDETPIPFGGIKFYSENGEFIHKTGEGSKNVIYTIKDENRVEFNRLLNSNINNYSLIIQASKNKFIDNKWHVCDPKSIDDDHIFVYIDRESIPWYITLFSVITISGEGVISQKSNNPNGYGVSDMWLDYYSVKKFEPWW